MTQDLLWTSENAATLNRLRMEKGLDAFQVARKSRTADRAKPLLFKSDQSSNRPPPSGSITKVSKSHNS
jgi:hypothetical protein